jgi:adenylate cyclase
MHAALLAHHFEEAGELLEAARWHEDAGRRVARSDPADGARHCRRVTTLLATVPTSRETLVLELTSRIALLEIGRIAGIDEHEARSLFDEARAVAERLRDRGGHAFLLTSYGRLCGLAGDVAQYLACAERAAGLADGSDDAVLDFEMRVVLAHAQLAVGRLAPARAIAERALAELEHVAGLRDAVGRSTAPALCRIWWALASAYLGNAAQARAALEALLDEESDSGLHALYGTHGFLSEVLRLRGDRPGALAHGRRAVELAEERGSAFSRVEAAAFLGAAELAAGDLAAATRVLESALTRARKLRTALWYEPRILATLAEARLAAGDRARAHALLAEARESVERGRGWRLSAFDVALARVRLLASEPVPDTAAVESALESLDDVAAELDAEPYRRTVAFERARLARAVSAGHDERGS